MTYETLARKLDQCLAAQVKLQNERDEVVMALRALTATARTFRNVSKDEQEWTPIDDEAIEAAFAVLAKINA